MSSPRTIAQEIVARLQAAGFAAFWVGGCVRDFLLGREAQDFDIATDATPEQVEKLFRKTIPVGRKFGVMIVVEGGQQFQVATFRAEADYQDGRRPEKVVFANAEADALRRDFTVNGLFYDPITQKIHDWVGGEKDLRAKTIRTIGVPEERFGEDHLRMLRAVRLAAQLNFEIEPQTFAAVKRLAPKIKLISAERVRDELIKLFAPPLGHTPALTPALSPGERGNVKDANVNPILPESAQHGSDELPLLGERAGVRADKPSPIHNLSSQLVNLGSQQSRAGVSPVRVGAADAPLALTRSPGRGDACPTLGFMEREKHAARGLVLLRDSGLLEHILPELTATVNCEQSPDFHPEGSVFNHICLMLENLPAGASESLPWAVLLHDIAKPVTAERDPATGSIHFYGHEKVGAAMAEEILKRLKFPSQQTEEIAACVLNHMQFKDVKQMRKATLRRMLLRETFPLELELHRLDCLGSHGSLEYYEFLVAQAAELDKQPAIRPPLLTGNDLIELGCKPGPALGALLREMREKQLQDELKTPTEARSWLKQKFTG